MLYFRSMRANSMPDRKKSPLRASHDGRRFRVLVALRLFETASQQKLAGLLSHLGAQNEWDIRLLRTQDELTAAALDAAEAQGLDGALVSIAHDAAIFRRLAALRCPLIVMGLDPAELRSRRTNLVVIHDNPADIARKALRHFAEAGRFAAFAYVHNRQRIGWSTLREQAFAKQTPRAIHVLPPTGTAEDRQEIAAFLRRLARPTAVLAANDARAADVLAAAAELKLKVPSELSVLGVDNDPFVCTRVRPSISSVEPDFFAEGQAAARFLDRMMRARTPMSTRHVEIDVRRVIPRESTARLLSAQALVDRAKEFVNAHATRGLTPQDVASHLHVSRQLLDLRFRESGTDTVGALITRRKLAEVKRLLAQTTASIAQVTELCGFKSENALKNLFKRTTGLSMRDWRRQSLHPVGDERTVTVSAASCLANPPGYGRHDDVQSIRRRSSSNVTGSHT